MSDPEFTHIVDLIEDKAETLKRASELRQTPSDGVVYSKWERNERAKPKSIILAFGMSPDKSSIMFWGVISL